MLGQALIGITVWLMGFVLHRVGRGVMGNVPREQDGPSMPRQRFGVNDAFGGNNHRVVAWVLMIAGAAYLLVAILAWLSGLI